MKKQASLTLETEQREPPVERLLPKPQSDGLSTVLALIQRVAVDPCADVEKLERMIAMYERLKAKEAELAYNAAKGRILKKLASIKIVKSRSVLNEIEQGKPQNGAYEAFKYAPLEEIDKHLRPLLAQEDMDLSYSDEPREDGGIVIRGRLKHLPGGHYEDSFMPAPPDTTGGKSSVQAVGSTNSFLRRYVACNIFNIVVVGDDDRSYISVIRSSFSTSARGSSATRSINAKTVEEPSDGDVRGSRSTDSSQWSVSSVRVFCFFIRILPSPDRTQHRSALWIRRTDRCPWNRPDSLCGVACCRPCGTARFGVPVSSELLSQRPSSAAIFGHWKVDPSSKAVITVRHFFRHRLKAPNLCRGKSSRLTETHCRSCAAANSRPYLERSCSA